MPSIGVITEQGDLGLGFEPITEEEREIIENNKKDNNEED